jgi:hypothetical protein
MIRRAIVLLAAAGVYILIKRTLERMTSDGPDEHRAEAEWANEGGQNSPASV